MTKIPTPREIYDLHFPNVKAEEDLVDRLVHLLSTNAPVMGVWFTRIPKQFPYPFSVLDSVTLRFSQAGWLVEFKRDITRDCYEVWVQKATNA